MRVAIVNTHTEKGGASRAAFRLGQGLAEQGDSVGYFVKRMLIPEALASGVEGIRYFRQADTLEAMIALVNTLYIGENRTSDGTTLFTFPGLGENPELVAGLGDHDIINLHWVEKFLTPADLSGIFRLQRPVVWTLHDQRPFTGGCHYSNGCTRYEKECGSCPQLDADPLDLSRLGLRKRRAVIVPGNLTLVSPSRWLAEKAANSALLGDCRVEVIPNGIDTSVYRPRDRRQAKAALGIAGDAVALMFGAQSSREVRKGFDILREAVSRCVAEPRIRALVEDGRLCVIHAGMENEDTASLPLPVINTGYIHDEAGMAGLYAAADIFVLPSREDNLPNTMLEAMACATPVLATAVGGITEVVTADNGVLVQGLDPVLLARALCELVENDERRTVLGERAAALVGEQYTITLQAQRYRSLFAELAAAPPAGTTPDGVDPWDGELLAVLGNSIERREAQHEERVRNHEYLRKAHRALHEDHELLKYRKRELEQAFSALLDDAVSLTSTSGRKQPRQKYRRYKAFMATVHRSAAWDKNRRGKDKPVDPDEEPGQ